MRSKRRFESLLTKLYIYIKNSKKKKKKKKHKEIIPFVHKWDEAGKYPASLRHKAYKAGIYGALWPREFGGTPPLNYDAFHMLIWHDELARAGSGGMMASCFLPPMWAALPLLKHHFSDRYSPEMIAKREIILRGVITGNETIALCVTEPTAGSDVANIQTYAKTDPNDPEYYLVNGEKYFISNGLNANYLTVAVRTLKTETETERNTKNSMKSLSFLLIDLNETKKGVFRSKMKTQGWWLGDTSYIIFRNAKVPKKYVIGERNKGFIPILSNFNHGRFAMASTACRYARVCLEDSIKFAQMRRTFNQKLIEHQVIRHKITQMIAKIEATYGLLERVTFMLKSGVTDKEIAGFMALCKIEASKCMEFCAREASQIFGGRSYLRGGTAQRIERIYREVTVMAIAEGATEVLSDLIAKQAKL